MENRNTWDWDNGDERRVSSVYKDIEAKNMKAEGIEATDIEPKDMEPPNIETSNIGTKDIAIEQEDNAVMENPAENVKPEGAANAFILVGEPQNQAPQNEKSQNQTAFAQSEFQPIVLSQSMQQGSGEQNQNGKKNQRTDYKADFSERDISENKVVAMAAYLLGAIGIIIALLASRDSAYTAFHVRQALKLTVSSVVLEIFAVVLAVFGMIPFVGIIFKLMLVIIGAAWLGVLVLRLAAIVQVCDGEAREPAVIGNLNLFK